MLNTKACAVLGALLAFGLVSAPLAKAALVAGYLFDGNAGTATPATVAELRGDTSLDLTLGGAAIYDSDTPFVFPSYPGTNTSMDVSGNAAARASNDAITAFQFANTDAFSVKAWIKTSTSGVGSQQVVSQRKASTGNGWSLNVLNSGQAQIFMQGMTVSQGRVAQGGPNVDDGQWHLLVGINDPNFDIDGAMQLYVDGILVDTSSKSQTESMDYGNSRFSVGTGRDLSTGNYNPFTGLIDEVAMFDHALSQTEVTAMFNESMVPEPSTGLLLGLGGLGGLAVRRRRS